MNKKIISVLIGMGLVTTTLANVERVENMERYETQSIIVEQSMPTATIPTINNKSEYFKIKKGDKYLDAGLGHPVFSGTDGESEKEKWKLQNNKLVSYDNRCIGESSGSLFNCGIENIAKFAISSEGKIYQYIGTEWEYYGDIENFATTVTITPAKTTSITVFRIKAGSNCIGLDENSNIKNYECGDSDTDQWKLVGEKLVNVYNNKCFSQTTAGKYYVGDCTSTQVQKYGMNANETQLYKKVNNVWINSSEIVKVVTNSNLSENSNYTYLLKYNISGNYQCLGLNGDRRSIVISECNSNDINQKWEVKNGKLVNYNNNNCLILDVNKHYVGDCNNSKVKEFKIDESNLKLYSKNSDSKFVQNSAILVKTTKNGYYNNPTPDKFTSSLFYTIKYGNKCTGFEENESGTFVKNQDCDNTSKQQWIFKNGALINAYNQKCEAYIDGKLLLTNCESPNVLNWKIQNNQLYVWNGSAWVLDKRAVLNVVSTTVYNSGVQTSSGKATSDNIFNIKYGTRYLGINGNSITITTGDSMTDTKKWYLKDNKLISFSNDKCLSYDSEKKKFYVGDCNTTNVRKYQLLGETLQYWSNNKWTSDKAVIEPVDTTSNNPQVEQDTLYKMLYNVNNKTKCLTYSSNLKAGRNICKLETKQLWILKSGKLVNNKSGKCIAYNIQKKYYMAECNNSETVNYKIGDNDSLYKKVNGEWILLNNVKVVKQ